MTGAVEVGCRVAVAADLETVAGLAGAARAALAAVRGGPVLLATDRGAGCDRGSLERAVDDEDTVLLVGTLDRVVVGYALAGLRPTPGGLLLAEVEELFVEPEARRVGVGAALFDQLLGWADEHGCDGIDALALPGDRATKNFFEGHGLVARAIISHRSLGPASGPPG